MDSALSSNVWFLSYVTTCLFSYLNQIVSFPVSTSSPVKYQFPSQAEDMSPYLKMDLNKTFKYLHEERPKKSKQLHCSRVKPDCHLLTLSDSGPLPVNITKRENSCILQIIFKSLIITSSKLMADHKEYIYMLMKTTKVAFFHSTVSFLLKGNI